MKPCEGPCDRVALGVHYQDISPFRVFLGLPFVYAPIVFYPLFFVSGVLIYLHLKMMGARNLKFMNAFVPDRKSHRYTLKSQIIKTRSPTLAFWVRTRIYWIFNCTFYCPMSVALLEWHAYLVKIVENWWCPFAHSQKPSYANGAIDRSFWHDPVDVTQLHPEDRDNPIWSQPPSPGPRPEKTPPGKKPASAG